MCTEIFDITPGNVHTCDIVRENGMIFDKMEVECPMCCSHIKFTARYDITLVWCESEEADGIVECSAYPREDGMIEDTAWRNRDDDQ